VTSEPVRDPRSDDLLTPQNAALVLIDYQDAQIYSIPVDPDVYVPNVVALAKVAKLFDLPIVLSVGLVLWAGRQLLRGPITPLAWTSALWYAHGLFRDYHATREH